jgi:hypothetical protein
VSAGYDCFFALKGDGTAWSWGANFYGMLGDCTYTNKSTPVKVGEELIPPVPGNNGNITKTNMKETSLTLHWTAAADNVTVPADLKYYVYQKEGAAFSMAGGLPTDGTLLNTGGTENITTYNVTDLVTGTSYYFIVVVEDERGNQAAYTALKVTAGANNSMLMIVVIGAVIGVVIVAAWFFFLRPKP